MVEDQLFYTKTMAQVLARQGKLQEAADIYRHLLSENEGHKEEETALAELEKRLRGKRNTRQRQLASLLAKWIELVLRLHGMQKLGVLMRSTQEQRT